MITVAMMKDHIHQLLVEHNIQAGGAKECLEMTGKDLTVHKGGAIINKRIIFIQGLETEEDYFAALHEIGHIVTNDIEHFDELHNVLSHSILLAEEMRDAERLVQGLQLMDRLKINAELDATDWARKNALVWTNRMLEFAVIGLASHYRNLPTEVVLRELTKPTKVEGENGKSE